MQPDESDGERLDSASQSRSARPCSASIGPTSQSTPTCESSTLSQARQMSLLAASPVRTLAGLDLATVLAGPDRDSGASSAALLAKYDRASQSWRTSQRSLLEEWALYAETWPESGMTQNGQLYRRAPWVRHTCDSECSLWPTPTASVDRRGFGIPLHDRPGRYKKSTVQRVHAMIGEHGWRIHPNFTEALMGYPTDWTEIEGPEMRSYRKSRSSCSEE